MALEMAFAVTGSILDFLEHVDLAVAPIGDVQVEFSRAPQSLHSADPVISLYFPATQAVQFSPSCPEYPMLQVQLVKDGLPEGERELGGQARHVDSEVAATVAE